MAKKPIKKKGVLDFTSVSDLFMMLSVLFLLMYVVNSINSGAISLAEKHKVSKELESKENEISVLKSDAILKSKNSSSRDRKALTKNLKKLKDLESEAKEIRIEQEKLVKLAIDREINFKSYRKLFESAVYGNFLTKDIVVSKQNEVMALEGKNKDLFKKHKKAKKDLKKVERVLTKTESSLIKTDSSLNNEKLKNKYTNLTLKNTKKKLSQTETKLVQKRTKIRKMEKKESFLNNEIIKKDQQLAELNHLNKEVKGSKKIINNKLLHTLGKIDKNKREIASLNSKNSSLKKFKNKYNNIVVINSDLKKKLSYSLNKIGENKKMINRISKNNEKLKNYKMGYENLLSLREKLEKDLNKFKNSNQKSALQIRKLKGIKEQYRDLSKKYNDLADAKITLQDQYFHNLKGSKRRNKSLTQLKEENQQLKKVKNKYMGLKGKYKGLIKERSELKGQLSGIAEKRSLREQIANNIGTHFRNNGIKAKINKKTGDVIVSFKDFYFHYGSSKLTPPMRAKLKKLIPIYGESIFSHHSFSNKIKSIEILGSASPTFNKKYINPNDISSKFAARAMSYNLDLSFQRAKSIFFYIFHNDDFQFKHKKKMVPFMKVSGLGYLKSKMKIGRRTASLRDKSLGYCGQYDCTKYQIVTIRFHLKEDI